jgi:hypothetical protein
VLDALREEPHLRSQAHVSTFAPPRASQRPLTPPSRRGALERSSKVEYQALILPVHARADSRAALLEQGKEHRRFELARQTCVSELQVHRHALHSPRTFGRRRQAPEGLQSSCRAPSARGLGGSATVAFSLLCLAFRTLLGALVRCRRGLDVKDVELLVLRHELLRHELEVPRRQVARSKLHAADRALRAAAASRLPRPSLRGAW